MIFATPVLLEQLGPAMDAERRNRVEAIHLGGLAVSAEQRENFAEHFPRAIVISGFGNTLFGMMPELAYDAAAGIDYFPHGGRLVAQVIEDAGPDAPPQLGRRRGLRRAAGASCCTVSTRRSSS